MSGNSGRIAKNTAFLYIRMLLNMIITLYTSRIVLEQLGVNDFGVYNVVGGIVSVFSILSASLSSAISRFLTFELGKGNVEKLKSIFSTSIIIQGSMALLVTIIIETIGVWFLNNKMNIMPMRLYAANWVLQCSIVTFVINMLSVPYNAAIIAHERMQAFAYIGLAEVTLKLGVAYSLYITIFDSLISYAVLLVVAALIIRIMYGVYCTRNFVECHIQNKLNSEQIKEMLSYSGWNFIGSSSAILRDQGVNIVMNLFCGTAVNAARGIAYQINNAVGSFSQNFMMAVNPQIIKSYASENNRFMFNLAFRSSKFSYCMMFCFSMPLIIEMQAVLTLWLTVIPDYTVRFAQLILIFGMSEAISIPLQYINQATGKIKIYQLTVGGIQMMNFPLSYLLLRFGASPISVFYLSIALSQICMFVRLLILHRSVGLSIKLFMHKVYIRIMLVSLFGLLTTLIIIGIIPANGIFYKTMIFVAVLVSNIIISYFVGCDSDEKSIIKNKIYKFILK